MPPEDEDEGDHYERLHRQYGGALSDRQHARVWSLAWEQGHSDGRWAVELIYTSLAEMATDILAIESDER